jgi:F-type H+-transporting ATPase subunit delta
MSDAVAERYARAIFELGVEAGQLEALTGQIRSFADIYGSSRELQSVLDNPMLELSKRQGILQEIAARVGLSGVGLNALRFLAQRRRLGSLPAMNEVGSCGPP